MEINQGSFTECECVKEHVNVLMKHSEWLSCGSLPCGSHCCPYCSVLATGIGTFSWVPCRQAGWCLARDAAGCTLPSLSSSS